MDQTTNTADLTETEKYLSESKEVLSDSDTEEEVVQDILLGGIRSGLSTITRTARISLSTCKTKTELDDATKRIEDSSLKLLKLEKSFIKTASIVADVIDDLASDYEDDENIQPHFFNHGPDFMSKIISPDKEGSGDAGLDVKKSIPHVFGVSEKNLGSVINFKDKLSKEFQERLSMYEETLTEEQLKEDEKFAALLTQINLGRHDAEISMKESGNTAPPIPAAEKEVEYATTEERFLSSIPYSVKDLLNYEYEPYNETNDMDHSVLPSVDPISKQPIHFPVRNKYCNHVFDRNSIYSHIGSNSNTTCPVHMCRNKRILTVDHFVTDSILTSHVRQKNNFE